jgi:hypothetical protein
LRAWNRLSKILARRGLAREPWEGPQAYAERIAAALPVERSAYAAEVAAIADMYAQLRYAAISPAQAAQLLQQMKMRIAQLARIRP